MFFHDFQFQFLQIYKIYNINLILDYFERTNFRPELVNMTEIKFGTDGWRAIIADTFTVTNVERVAYATAQWILKNGTSPVCVVGFDCRFGGPMFAQATARVLCACC